MKMDLTVLLSILAILLAMLALVPYGLEIYFYFTKKPKFRIQIANKKLSKRGKEKVFDFWLGIQPKNVSLLINRVVLSLPFEIKPEQSPGSTRNIEIIPPLEGTEFGPTLLLEYGEAHYHPKSGKAYMIRTVFHKKVDSIKATLIVESEVDVLKLGFWSIFYRTRRYRKQKVINIKIDSKRQELTM